ncbi:hypothetical protein COO91_10875 (plasmid) [Nostoc flagelliforme CCNUN1]|uniref:Uncharacterized protein n=1 Tax=Nostoc flagelliforme CCNUN1 TaxID=2038116 RepID=A0A2K8TAB0_9NOSO|nr:hypothetical protein COO91_10875 [Nostoc flagelliforme CCNUN1]
MRQGIQYFLDSLIPATLHPLIQLYQGFALNKRAIHAQPPPYTPRQIALITPLVIYPSSVTLRKLLPFLNSRAFV